MNPKDSSEITVQTLLALRQETDAIRIITDKLRVKDMGPADHIRTKHEVKTFVETGDLRTAEALIKQAGERMAAHQSISIRVTEKQNSGERISN